MRFFTALVTFGLVAFAAAQNATSTEKGSTTAAVSSTATASLSAQVRCLQQCGSADVCCQAACVNVPCPSQMQANATTECAAKCPQGNGTASETQEYADCQASCISSYFLTSTAPPAATATGGAASATATFGGSQASTTGASATGGNGATSASGSASASSTSHSGAEGLRLGAVGVGFLGLVMAGLAL